MPGHKEITYKHRTNQQPRKPETLLTPKQSTVPPKQETVVHSDSAEQVRTLVSKAQKTFFAKHNHTPRSEINNFAAKLDF
ncbi:MAG: hypothetical protein NTW08_03910 [Gammaproteobacteria bacterium]|nr:hypothetical protein [Gammaproteobacteria bacterium]